MGRIRQRTARRENDGQIQVLVSDCDRLNQEVSSSVTLFLCLFTVYVWAAPEQGAQLAGVSADLLSIQRRILWTPELKVKQDVQNESSCEPSWLTVRFQSRSLRESSSVVVCLKRHYRTSMFPSVSNNEALRSQVKLRVGNKTPKPTFLQIGPLNAR